MKPLQDWISPIVTECVHPPLGVKLQTQNYDLVGRAIRDGGVVARLLEPQLAKTPFEPEVTSTSGIINI